MRRKSGSTEKADGARGVHDNFGSSGVVQGNASVGESACERQPEPEAAFCEIRQASPLPTRSGARNFPSIGGTTKRNRKQRGWVKREKRDGVYKWIGYWKDGGKRKEKTLGQKTAEFNKGDAETKLEDEIIPEYFASKSGVKSEKRKVPTFREAANTYLKLREPHWGRNSNITFKSIFKEHIIPVLGDFPVTDIYPSQIQAFFNLKAEGSESLVKKIVTHTRAVFDICIEDDVPGLVRNPAKAKMIRKPKVRRPIRNFLQVSQIDALLQTVLCQAGRDYMLLRVAFVCGLRPSELFALRCDDVLSDKIRVDEAVVLGDLKETKTEASAAPVPLPMQLKAELLSYIRREGISDQPRAFLFPNELGTAMCANNYRNRTLYRLGALIGVPKLNFQIIRRSTGTHFQDYGEIKDTQALLRHADPQTTLGIYQQTITENLTAASNAWDRRICPSKEIVQ